MKYKVEFEIDLRRNIHKGMYIAIEGIDGSGKTTQVDRLEKYFYKQGKEVVKTREPRKDSGMIADLVQKILQGKTKIPPVAFQYLFSADREMHHEELVIPALREGKVVITDRCFWSAVPYGLLDRKADIDENSMQYMLAAQSILSMYHQFIVPDFTFYLDIPLGIAMDRIRKKKELREIYEDEEKLVKIVNGYQWLLQEFKKEFVVVEGTRSVEEITGQIIRSIEDITKQ
jgi:dTMP kinase